MMTRIEEIIHEFEAFRDQFADPRDVTNSLCAALLTVAFEISQLKDEYRELAAIINPPKETKH